MTGLAVVWVIPGGAVITAIILKYSHKTRPSAFQADQKDVDTPLCLKDDKTN